MVICISAGFSYSVLMWPRFAVYNTSYKFRQKKKHYVLCFEINRKDLEERVPLFPGKEGRRGKGVGEGGKNPSVFPDLMHTSA